MGGHGQKVQGGAEEDHLQVGQTTLPQSSQSTCEAVEGCDCASPSCPSCIAQAPSCCCHASPSCPSCCRPAAPSCCHAQASCCHAQASCCLACLAKRHHA